MLNVIATLKYYLDTVTILLDGQVCFCRWLFADPVKPQRITTDPVGPRGGLLRQHGVPTAPNIHFSSCYGCLLWLFLSTTEQTTQLSVSTGSCSPPTTSLPPLICNTHDIAGSVQKPLIPAIATSFI